MKPQETPSLMSQMDTQRYKAQERAGFNRIAAAYADGAPLRARLADALVDAAGLAPGQQVLDLASGPALLAAAAARRVAPGGLVLATDIAEDMMAEGRRRIAGSARPAFAVADAEQLGLADGCFDRVLAGLALFLFPQPDKALKEVRRVLRPGGRFVLSVWGARDRVPLIGCALDGIARGLPPPKVARPSVCRYGEPGALEATLSQAGFDDIRLQPCEFDCRFDDADAYWQAFLGLAGGAAEALSRVPAEGLAKVRAATADALETYRDADGGYRLSTLTLIASARRPA